MSEDISGMIKLGVTISILGSFLLAAVILIGSLAFSFSTDYARNLDSNVQSVYNSVTKALPYSKGVTAAMAYRFIVERETEISQVRITYIHDGITEDKQSLLRHADAFVDIKCKQTPGTDGMYSVEILEVER